MNKVILMGRLTRDPEVRYSQGESPMAIARFSLAVDRRGRSNSEKYLRNGTTIVLTGRIQTGSYTNKDGAKVYTTDIVAEEFEFAESKNASAGNGDYSGFGGGSRPEPMSAGDGFMNIPDGIDEELPFN